jgi:calcineurin-like phosphoesterase family protein
MTFVTKHYIADTHFSHAGMLTFGNRPFSSTEEMDRTLIENWRRTVKPTDIVYVLGDFSMGLNDSGRVTLIFNQLPGIKHLVLGNHDLHRDGEIHPTIAALNWASRPEHLKVVADGQKIVLSHYALRVWPGDVHFFGHSHGKLPGTDKSRDVGVDMSDVAFAPRTARQLIANMEQETADE